MTHDTAEQASLRLTVLSEDERHPSRQRARVRGGAGPAARPRDGRAREDSARRSSTSCSSSASWASRSRRATAAPAATFFHAVLAVEELSRVDPSIGVLVDVQNTLVINALLRWGSDDLKRRYLPRLAVEHGRRLRAVGSRIGQRRVRADDARRERRRRIASLTGRKLWITNGNEADLFIVFANVESRRRLPRHHRVPRRARHRRASPSARRKTSSASARAAPASCCSRTAACRARTCSARSARATRSRSKR